MPKVSPEYRQARRAAILDAARRSFLARGFDGTSMHDVLAEAGMSSGALYRYFSSKHDMIMAIVEENIEAVVAVLEDPPPAASELTVAEVLARVMATITRKHRENGFGAIALLVWSEATRDQELRTRLSGLLDTYRVRFAQLAAATGLAAGSRSADSVGVLCTSVIAGVILHLVVQGEDALAEIQSAADELLSSPAHLAELPLRTAPPPAPGPSARG